MIKLSLAINILINIDYRIKVYSLLFKYSGTPILFLFSFIYMYNITKSVLHAYILFETSL